MHGAAVCVAHGGAAPQVKRAAGRRLAVAEFAKSFGEIAQDADPSAVVLGEIRWCAGHVAWLRSKVQETEPDALIWGLESTVAKGSGEFPGVDITEAAKASMWVVLYGQERDRLVRMCEIAHRMGIEERMVQLAEKAGAAMSEVIRRVLADAELTPPQYQAVTLRLPDRLRELSAQLAHLN